MDAFKLILVSLAGWMNHQHQQQHMIEYLQEEVRILKQQQGSRRPKFTDEQRRRLAGKAKLIRYGRLKAIVGLLTPLPRPVRDPAIDPEGEHRRDRPRARWGVDEAGRAEPDRLLKRIPHWMRVPHP
ncbi:MAG: hypothetical protein ACI9UA_000610 [Pseudoalteromonas tetraodonis]|jgi:hypothetical protein